MSVISRRHLLLAVSGALVGCTTTPPMMEVTIGIDGMI